MPKGLVSRLRPATRRFDVCLLEKKRPARGRAKVGGEKEETPRPTQADGCGAPSA
jgi:hypothetical protein